MKSKINVLADDVRMTSLYMYAAVPNSQSDMAVLWSLFDMAINEYSTISPSWSNQLHRVLTPHTIPLEVRMQHIKFMEAGTSRAVILNILILQPLIQFNHNNIIFIVTSKL